MFVPAVPAWKTYTKNAVLWLFSWGLLSMDMTQQIIDRLELWDA